MPSLRGHCLGNYIVCDELQYIKIYRLNYLNISFLTQSDPSTYIYVPYLYAFATRVRKYTYPEFH